jgi:hypothetical protein
LASRLLPVVTISQYADVILGTVVTLAEVEVASRRWARRRPRRRRRDRTAVRETFVRVAKAWLRFLPCLEEVVGDKELFVEQLDEFAKYLRDERGLSPNTINTQRRETRRARTGLAGVPPERFSTRWGGQGVVIFFGSESGVRLEGSGYYEEGSNRATHWRRLLRRVPYGSAGNRRHHQRQTPHEEIDSDEKTECPGHAPRPARNDDSRENQIGGATDRRPRPRAREQLPVLERRQYLHGAVGREEDGQGDGQGGQPGKRPPNQEGTDEDSQHRADHGPYEARCIPCREQGCEPYEPGRQK